jgi:hypothetical protein
MSSVRKLRRHVFSHVTLARRQRKTADCPWANMSSVTKLRRQIFTHVTLVRRQRKTAQVPGGEMGKVASRFSCDTTETDMLTWQSVLFALCGPFFIDEFYVHM